MITDVLWMNDSKLLQELNLTARQPRRAPHHVIHLVSQMLPPSKWRSSQPHRGYQVQTRVHECHAPRCYHYSIVPRGIDPCCLSQFLLFQLICDVSFDSCCFNWFSITCSVCLKPHLLNSVLMMCFKSNQKSLFIARKWHTASSLHIVI